MVQPGEADLGNRPSPPADHQAGVARQGHEQIPRIAHAAGNKYGARPVFQADVGGRNDANHGTASSEGALRGDARGRGCRNR